MLPRGLAADLASFSDQQALKSLHPEAQTVARILAGRCSCDLVRPRLADTREDERHLRARYRQGGVTRDATVKALDRHRREIGLRVPPEGWPKALTQFVAEHARNAGPSLYYLHFSLKAEPLTVPPPARPISLALVTAAPGSWLAEDSPTMVSR